MWLVTSQGFDLMAGEGISRALAKFSASSISNIGGALIGIGASAIGLNPMEAASIGGLATTALDRVGSEILEWKVSPRQEMRIGRVYSVACQRLRMELEQGATIREDGFFDAANDRSAADEVLETAIRAAMEAAQEQKVDFIGALWARIAVNSKIDLATSHLLLECARTISFRGYALLKFAAEKSDLSLPVRGDDKVASPSHQLEPLLVEAYDLTRRGLLVMKDHDEDADTFAVLGSEDIDPARLYLSVVGRLLYENLDLCNLSSKQMIYIETIAGMRSVAMSGRGSAKIDGGIF